MTKKKRLRNKLLPKRRPSSGPGLNSSPAKLPIGVFDSGLGGLTIVREMRRLLPRESIYYFGDIARLPYGTKSKEQILRFSVENTQFLMKRGIKALVIACNSSASAAYDFLRRTSDLPVVDVITPAVEEALRVTRSGNIGVIGTQATVDSEAYKKALQRKNPRLKVQSVACPLFVPIVEEGSVPASIQKGMMDHYLNALKRSGIDTLILGCTHYPMLKPALQSYFGKRVALVDSARPCVLKLMDHLEKENLYTPRKTKGHLDVFVSDLPRNFTRLGENFLREKLHKVQVVR